MGAVVLQYAAMNDAHHRQEWQLSLSHQVRSWRERAQGAIGASASIGIAVGGAAATAAGAAMAVAQGIVQGVSSASSSGGGQALMPPPLPRLPPPDTLPDTPSSQPLAIRRSNSTGDLENLVSEPCPKCDLNQRRKPHTYRGTCRGLPPGVYFQPRGSKRIADAIATTPTEVTRQAEEIVVTPAQSVLGPEEELDRHLDLHNLRLREPTSGPNVLAPQVVPHSTHVWLKPCDAQGTPVPPSSFGSANSHGHQSFYVSGEEPFSEALPLEAPVEVPALGAGEPVTIESSGRQTESELKTQLLRVIASNEELARAVSELQVSVSDLEIQVSDLQ